MNEQEQRAKVVACALEWDGTPYRHGGRLKKIGADCTFLAVVYEEAGLVEKIAVPPYTPQAHLHKAGTRYLDAVMRHAKETETPLPGDIALYQFGMAFSHGAIIIDPGWPTVIHGDMSAGLIVRALGDQANFLKAKARKFFTLWPSG